MIAVSLAAGACTSVAEDEGSVFEQPIAAGINGNTSTTRASPVLNAGFFLPCDMFKADRFPLKAAFALQ